MQAWNRGDATDVRAEQGSPRSDRPQPKDKPKSRHAIPGCEPWVLVYTKYGRRFVYNTEKDQSFWRIPEKLKEGILAVDQQRIKAKADAIEKEKARLSSTVEISSTADAGAELEEPDKDDSEYEEVEVTDDESESAAVTDGSQAKRQKTEEVQEEPLHDFGEDDIAYQLAAMGQEYGLDPGEYDDGTMEWEPGAEGLQLSDEDAVALFKDLLSDAGINPYSSWEKLIEEGRLVDDTRYTALPTTKARREVWEEWCRDKIEHLKQMRAKEEKKDPRIPYLSFLQARASPKLYWPEFKRKYKKEAAMRDSNLSDKEREKLYREHINQLKLPIATLKADLLALLKQQPTSVLNNTTMITHLPPSVLTDIKYISLDSDIRDTFIETYIATLPAAPVATDVDESEEAIKQRKGRERREMALQERERQVGDEKRRQERDLRAGKGRLREEEAEIQRALQISKSGLKNQLLGAIAVDNGS